MKVVITGSLGHISKPLTNELVQKGHEVTVISSKPEKQNDIEALGATAAIGNLEDVDFLTAIFTGADAVYLIVPPVDFFDHSLDITAYYKKLGNNYVQAIQQSGVKRIVYLSALGAHLDKVSGFLYYISHEVENILKQLPGDVSITFLRPAGLYYNLFFFVSAIKTRGQMMSIYGGDEKELWASPKDVAGAVAEEIEIKNGPDRKIRYVASDEVTPNIMAEILGEAIGKPDLKWVTISDEQWLKALISAGMNPNSAKGLVEQNACKRGGVLFEDFYKNKPTFGKVKMKDFAKEFAAAFLA